MTSSRKSTRGWAAAPGQFQSATPGQIEIEGRLIRSLRQTHALQHLPRQALGVAAPWLLQEGGDEHVLQDRQLLEGPFGLKGSAHAELRAAEGRSVADILAEKGDPAALDRHETGDGVEKGGLAGAVGPDEAQDFRRLERQGDAVHSHHAAEANGDVPSLERFGIASEPAGIGSMTMPPKEENDQEDENSVISRLAFAR